MPLHWNTTNSMASTPNADRGRMGDPLVLGRPGAEHLRRAGLEHPQHQHPGGEGDGRVARSRHSFRRRGAQADGVDACGERGHGAMTHDAVGDTETPHVAALPHPASLERRLHARHDRRSRGERSGPCGERARPPVHAAAAAHRRVGRDDRGDRQVGAIGVSRPADVTIASTAVTQCSGAPHAGQSVPRHLVFPSKR